MRSASPDAHLRAYYASQHLPPDLHEELLEDARRVDNRKTRGQRAVVVAAFLALIAGVLVLLAPAF